MANPKFNLAVMAAGVALALSGTVAEASHFRGAAMIPSVNANGLLTINATSFWRPTAVADIDESGSISVSGVGGMTQFGPQVNDTSDSRFTKVTSTHTIQLPGAGLYSISASSCCRVSGTSNTASNTWTMNAAIFWNGNSANTPILFNFSNVQPEVLRGAAYSGNLGALAGAGVTLTYDQVLNSGIFSQPQGFTIDPNTGALSILASATTLANYPDNPSNAGADKAFSGNIKASDGSFVEFEWLFDGVNALSNLAPNINDQIINALVGDNINTVMTATDDGLPLIPGALSWTDIGLLSPQGSCSNAPVFNIATQAFTWNTANCAAGNYLYQVQVSDGEKTDFGTLSINLRPGQVNVPEPATLALFGLGALGLGAFSRRRKS